MNLTVAICTYRRADLLPVTLDSLGSCHRPAGCQWELVVIDNGCDDAIRAIVLGHTPALAADGIPVRYVAEPTLGTSHARNRAVREARGQIVLFTDDDVTFDPAWLVSMWNAITNQPGCDFWGGRVEPVFPRPGPRLLPGEDRGEGRAASGARHGQEQHLPASDAIHRAAIPRWFDPSLCPMLGDTIVQYRRGDRPRPWDPTCDPPFYTANLALRRSAMLAVGGFDTTVGHRGGQRMGMEDSLMVKAIAAARSQASAAYSGGWYAADAVVHHPVPPERLTRRYARAFARRQGWMSIYELRKQHQGSVPRWLYRVAMNQLLQGLAQQIHGLITLHPARRFAGTYRVTFAASKLWHAMAAGRD